MPFITSVVLIIAGSAPAHAQGAELPPLIERAPRLSEGVFGIGAGLAVGEPTGFNIALALLLILLTILVFSIDWPKVQKQLSSNYYQ